MPIVGLDLGFRHTGLVVAEPDHSPAGYHLINWACFHTSNEGAKKHGLYVAVDDIQECKRIYRGVIDVINDVKATALVAETPSGGAKGARAARAMGIVTGVVAAISEQAGIPSVWVQPHQSKMQVGGKKNASKEEMEEAVFKIWPDFKWPKLEKELEHVCDAAAALVVAKSSDVYKYLRGRAP